VFVLRAANEEVSDEEIDSLCGGRPDPDRIRGERRGDARWRGRRPGGAGVTVGQSPSHERRTTVIKEREPRDETVVIRKERREPRDKVIIRERE
jgi:hypothetical protein